MNRARPARSFATAVLPLSALLVLGSAPLTACSAPQSRAQVELSKLPPYEGKDVELYTDLIEPSALGLTMDRPSFRGDARFKERAQKATIVARVKVTTVTIDKVDDKSTYHVTMTVIGQPLAGTGDTSLEMTVREGDKSYGVVNQLRENLRDKTLLAMWKHFRQGDDDTEHFYVAPDDDGTVSAAKEAIVLQEVSKK